MLVAGTPSHTGRVAGLPCPIDLLCSCPFASPSQPLSSRRMSLFLVPHTSTSILPVSVLLTPVAHLLRPLVQHSATVTACLFPFSSPIELEQSNPTSSLCMPPAQSNQKLRYVYSDVSAAVRQFSRSLPESRAPFSFPRYVQNLEARENVHIPECVCDGLEQWYLGT